MSGLAMRWILSFGYYDVVDGGCVGSGGLAVERGAYGYIAAVARLSMRRVHAFGCSCLLGGGQLFGRFGYADARAGGGRLAGSGTGIRKGCSHGEIATMTRLAMRRIYPPGIGHSAGACIGRRYGNAACGWCAKWKCRRAHLRIARINGCISVGIEPGKTG